MNHPRLTAAALTSDRQLTLTAMADVETPEGDVARFTLDAYSGGVMYPRLNGIGWDGPVVISISGIRNRDTIPVHRNHDPDRPVGHGAAELGERITVKGTFSIDSQDSREILSGARNGFPWRASVGLSNMLYAIADAGQKVTANGQEWDGPILHVIEADLDEVSFVTIAGDPNVSPAIAANKRSGAIPMNFSAWLKSKGWDEAALNADQLAQLKGIFEGEQANAADAENADAEANADADTSDDSEAFEDEVPADAEPELVAGRRNRQSLQSGRSGNQVNLAAQREAAAAEEERIAAIREIGSTIGNPTVEGGATLTAHAIREGWSANRTALYATRNRRPAAPAIHSTSPAQRGSTEALQAGILLRAGANIDAVLPRHHQIPAWMSLPVDDPNRQRIMDNSQQYRDLEMIEYVAQGLQAMGRSQSSFGMGRSGRLQTLEAGFATGAVSAIFTQSIGARALATYMESGDFSRGWTSESDVPNLISTDRPRMGAGQDLKLHPTGGEAESTNRSAVSESVKADRYSRSCEIDENDFINDRFQLLRDQPVEFGRAAARLRPTMVAAVLMANDTLADGVALFHAASHSNLTTGSALSASTLRAARAKMEKQVDGDASLNLPVTHLIVPSDLGDTAIQLTMSAIITNDSGAGGTNPLRARNIMPVNEARLANGVVNPTTGSSIAGSTTSWYLASNEGHTIEVQFLEGTGRMPQVIVSQLTGGKFGLNITVKHFIGAKALDYRALAKINA